MKKIYVLMLVLAVSTIVSATPYYGWMSEETVTAGTVGLWKWNESSGNAANAVTSGLPLYKNGTMNYGTGKFGNGAVCPGGTAGTDNWQIALDSGNGRNMDAIGTDPSLSVAVWIKPNVLPTASSPRQMLFDKANSHTPTAGYQLYLWYDTVSSSIYLKAAIGTVGSANVQCNKVIGLVSGEWTHVAMTWNAADDTLRVYQDGSVLGSTVSAGKVYAPSITGSTNPQLLRAGQRIGATYGTFNGVLDDLKVNNVAVEYAPEPATAAILALGMLLFRKRK